MSLRAKLLTLTVDIAETAKIYFINHKTYAQFGPFQLY
jgi:hypothetical protein